MTNKELMVACGSTSGSYDPESPEQTRWTLQNGEGEEKALAWVKMTSLHRRSPYCVNEADQSLWLDSMAADNGWTLRTAENYAYKLNSQGRIRLKGKRIWYRADATVDLKGRTNGEQTDSVQSQNLRQIFAFPPYVIEHIERLPEEQREPAARKYASYMEWDRAGLASTVAAWRAISAPFEDNILREIGMEKKRLPKRRNEEIGAIQLQLLEMPDFVQTNSRASLYNSENGHVQSENGKCTNGVSLLSSDSDSDREAGGLNVHRKNGSKPAGPPETPPPDADDPLLLMLAGCGFAHLDPEDVGPIREALGKTPLAVFEGIVRDRLTRGRVGQPILIELAKKAHRTQKRMSPQVDIERRVMSSPPDPEAAEFIAWCQKRGAFPSGRDEILRGWNEWQSRRVRGAHAGP